jgi:hypothetical protein
VAECHAIGVENARFDFVAAGCCGGCARMPRPKRSRRGPASVRPR